MLDIGMYKCVTQGGLPDPCAGSASAHNQYYVKLTRGHRDPGSEHWTQSTRLVSVKVQAPGALTGEGTLALLDDNNGLCPVPELPGDYRSAAGWLGTVVAVARHLHRGVSPVDWLNAELQTIIDAAVDSDEIGRALSAAVATRYWARWGSAKVLDEFQYGRFWYLFDSTPEGKTDPKEPANRVLASWGVSEPDRRFGHRQNLRGFPVPPVNRKFDRGHLIAMSVGGGDYVNLVPQEPRLNRGWSNAGKRWRSLERAVAADAGAFVFVAVHYDDLTDIPSWFGYVVVHTDHRIRIESFSNHTTSDGTSGRNLRRG